MKNSGIETKYDGAVDRNSKHFYPDEEKIITRSSCF